ncbi:MAG TPA: beta-propeller fold lactonase family protein [Burkholderiales bacterium]|nr:beta-propeller fold lactonase family protein [Burkholderiales bacterium]
MSKSFVYVSNAEDGEISCYTLNEGGALEPGPRVKADKGVMPMGISPDRRYLVAAVRGETSQAYTYSIDRTTGALRHIGTAPLAANCPYIFFDRNGRFLLGASYSQNRVVVHRVNDDGTIGETVQAIPTARNAHAIRTDETNRYAFVPHLGTDQVFQFLFDETSGRLAANTPPLLQMAQGSGPRHLVTSPDNRFVYVLAELTATVTTCALDGETGLLTEVSSASALPPGSTFVPGAPRGPSAPARDVSNDIWASDLHITPDSKFLYAAERTGSTIATFGVDSASGALTPKGVTETEKQPRGFRIDASGRTMVVSGEQSEMLSSYAIAPGSGALSLVGRYPTGRGANWVEIVSFE